jgi:hypothetical protein
MAKSRPEDIPALVLAVIAKVYELSGRRTQPWYISRSAVELVDAADAVNSAIYYAEVSGWLVDQASRRMALPSRLMAWSS